MTLNLATLLRESARAYPDRTAVILGEDELSYAAVHRGAQELAGRLRQLGIARGEHVALMLPNVPHFTIAYFGAHYAGCPVVPLNVMLTPDEIAYHLEDSDAAALIVWEDLLDQGRAGFCRVDGCRELVVAHAGDYDLGARAPPIEDVPDTMPDDTAVILYTSGTTGRPKGAELTHYNLVENARAAVQQAPPDEDTTVLLVLPLFHSFGQTVLQNATIMDGGTLVLTPRFDALIAATLIERHRVNFFAGVPTMYFGMLHHPEVTDAMLDSLDRCVSGGASMPVEVMNAFNERFNVRIMEGYGLSETSPLASYNPIDKRKPGSIGVPIWGVEFRLVDDTGAVIAATDVAGEIQIKGHAIMKGYYKQPDATAATITDGWMSTGDIATRDADGYYYIVDRKKDLIIRGGYNVYPREVEEVLYAHPAVAEAAVIGIPHESLGEEIKAVVAFKPGCSAGEAELQAHCKQHLAAYKYPRVIEVIDELPKGPTGKILKRELRDLEPARPRNLAD